MTLGIYDTDAAFFFLHEMKKRILVLSVLAIAICAMLLGPLVVKHLNWSQNYQEAEPYVEMIWPLAEAMESFHETQGKNPTSLEQISSDSEVLALMSFDPEFTPEESTIFTVMINEMFGFVISDEYHAGWVFSEDL